MNDGGPFIKKSAPERETMADKPGGYLTSESLSAAMEIVQQGRHQCHSGCPTNNVGLAERGNICGRESFRSSV